MLIVLHNGLSQRLSLHTLNQCSSYVDGNLEDAAVTENYEYWEFVHFTVLYLTHLHLDTMAAIAQTIFSYFREWKALYFYDHFTVSKGPIDNTPALA